MKDKKFQVNETISKTDKEEIQNLEYYIQTVTSGAIQYGVPTTECVLRSASFNFVATPKSASLTRP